MHLPSPCPLRVPQAVAWQPCQRTRPARARVLHWHTVAAVLRPRLLHQAGLQRRPAGHRRRAWCRERAGVGRGADAGGAGAVGHRHTAGWRHGRVPASGVHGGRGVVPEAGAGPRVADVAPHGLHARAHRVRRNFGVAFLRLKCMLADGCTPSPTPGHPLTHAPSTSECKRAPSASTRRTTTTAPTRPTSTLALPPRAQRRTPAAVVLLLLLRRRCHLRRRRV